jgi:hypothetical protein
MQKLYELIFLIIRWKVGFSVGVVVVQKVGTGLRVKFWLVLGEPPSGYWEPFTMKIVGILGKDSGSSG